jgi:acyl-CoA synthetase (NDP forming)
MIRAHGARLLGPNCLGISSAAVGLNATFAARSAPPGNIGFSSQSGALGLALLEACESRGLGLSAFVSIGNKADVSSNDLVEWWEDDPRPTSCCSTSSRSATRGGSGRSRDASRGRSRSSR